MQRKLLLELARAGGEQGAVDSRNLLPDREQFESHSLVLHQQVGDGPLQVFNAGVALVPGCVLRGLHTGVGPKGFFFVQIAVLFVSLSAAGSARLVQPPSMDRRSTTATRKHERDHKSADRVLTGAVALLRGWRPPETGGSGCKGVSTSEHGGNAASPDRHRPRPQRRFTPLTFPGRTRCSAMRLAAAPAAHVPGTGGGGDFGGLGFVQ